MNSAQTSVQDADGDAITYAVEIWAEGSAALVASATGIEGGEGEPPVSWQAPVLLPEDHWYEWSVMALDETGLESDWTTPESFFYSVQNAAPQGVELVAPEAGTDLVSNTPAFVATEGSDVDVKFTLKPYETNDFVAPIWNLRIVHDREKAGQH